MSVYMIPNSTTLSLIFLGIVSLCGCVVNQSTFDPNIVYYPSRHTLEKCASPFPTTESEPLDTLWKEELFIGIQFAKEFDLYRAITCFKRALFLAPPEERASIEYRIVESYYLGRKFREAIEFYESSSLPEISLDFPPLKELLLILYDAYQETNQCDKADRVLNLLESLDQSLADKIEEYQAVIDADFCTLEALQERDPDLSSFLFSYAFEAKSVRHAETLNALFPGAGYYYVGQPKTALTSFVINALFTYAAYQFFDRGYIAAGLIVTSLEMGWYLGGINGAGIAAREWNEGLYAAKGKEFLVKKGYFPVLMFNYAF